MAQNHVATQMPISIYQRIYTSALKLLYQYTPEKTYETIVKEAMKLIGAKYGSLFIMKDNALERVYTSHAILNQIIPRKRGNTWKAFTKQRPYIYNLEKLGKLHPEIHKLNISSDIGIPISFDNKSFGVLSVLSPENVKFTNMELMILQMFSPLASLALRNATLYSETLNTLKAQDLFISMAAHELKTPLTAISIYAQLIMQGNTKGKLTEVHMKEKLYSEIQRLSKLVNELLQVSQIRKGRMQFSMKRCDLAYIITQAVTNFQTTDKNHIIQFKNHSLTEKYIIKGDKDKLIQVITNLLTNAAKFSSKNTKIRVSLKAKQEHFEILVKDHGIGMTEQQKAKVFEGFYKASPMKKEGLGLGLFLVKNIIIAHHGTIHVESRPEKGSTFRILLPKQPIHA